jgi:hypothetical protein
MKPLKSLKPFAIWMFRIAAIPIIFNLYFNSVSTLNFSTSVFYIGIIMFIAAILLISGGVFNKQGLTVISGLIISIISLYKIIISFNGIFDSFIMMHFIPFSIGLFFFSNGNET